MADDPYSLNRYCLNEHRIIVVKPGDILVVGRSEDLNADLAGTIKQALKLSAVVALPDEVDVQAVRYPTADGR